MKSTVNVIACHILPDFTNGFYILIMVLRQRFKGILAICGGVLVHLSLGTLYTFGKLILASLFAILMCLQICFYIFSCGDLY
jgi:hypothetical protein